MGDRERRHRQIWTQPRQASLCLLGQFPNWQPGHTPLIHTFLLSAALSLGQHVNIPLQLFLWHLLAYHGSHIEPQSVYIFLLSVCDRR